MEPRILVKTIRFTDTNEILVTVTLLFGEQEFTNSQFINTTDPDKEVIKEITDRLIEEVKSELINLVNKIPVSYRYLNR